MPCLEPAAAQVSSRSKQDPTLWVAGFPFVRKPTDTKSPAQDIKKAKKKNDRLYYFVVSTSNVCLFKSIVARGLVKLLCQKSVVVSSPACYIPTFSIRQSANLKHSNGGRRRVGEEVDISTNRTRILPHG